VSTTFQIPSGGGTLSLSKTSTTVAAGSDGVALPTSSIAVASTTGFPAAGAVLVQTATGPTPVQYASRDATHFLGCSGGTGTLAAGNEVDRIIVDGPHSIPDSATNWSLTVNRNVGATPIDGLATTACLWMLFQVSLDGGTTWKDNMGGELNGGLIEPTTTVAAGSDGVALPASSIEVAGTKGFSAGGGTVTIQASGGPTSVTYTSKDATHLLGCSGGTGTLATGDQVTGPEFATSGISSDLPAGTSRQARAGFAPLATFTVSGSLTLTP